MAFERNKKRFIKHKEISEYYNLNGLEETKIFYGKTESEIEKSVTFYKYFIEKENMDVMKLMEYNVPLYKALKRGGYNTVVDIVDLVQNNTCHLFDMRWFGLISVQELIKLVQQAGYIIEDEERLMEIIIDFKKVRRMDSLTSQELVILKTNPRCINYFTNEKKICEALHYIPLGYLWINQRFYSEKVVNKMYDAMRIIIDKDIDITPYMNDTVEFCWTNIPMDLVEPEYMHHNIKSVVDIEEVYQDIV